MSLIKYGIAVGLGYHLGQPHGRRQLKQLRRQIVRLSKRPEVKQLQERAWNIAGEHALAARTSPPRRCHGLRRQTARQPQRAPPWSMSTPPRPPRYRARGCATEDGASAEDAGTGHHPPA